MNDERLKKIPEMIASFEPSVHIAGITPKKSKISDVIKILGTPDKDMDSNELSPEEYTLESVRIVKYHKIGLQFCIGIEDVDEPDPVINVVKIMSPFKGKSTNGLYIGMPCEEAIKICTQDYQALKRQDLIGTYRFGDIESAWQFTVECEKGFVVRIIDEGARKSTIEKEASKIDLSAGTDSDLFQDFELSGSIAGIVASKSKISDVLRTFGKPEQVIPTQELYFEDEIIASDILTTNLRLRYPSIGLCFSVDEKEDILGDPVITAIDIEAPFKAISSNGLYIGMPRKKALEICGKDYETLTIEDSHCVFCDRKRAWVMELDFSEDRLSKIRDNGVRREPPEEKGIHTDDSTEDG